MLDGSLGSDAAGAGNDYLEGGDGDDVLSGGGGSDLVIGGAGDDVASGEGRGTVGHAADPRPSLADRLVDCATVTRVVHGYVDLNGDLLAGPTGPTGTAPDDGRPGRASSSSAA